MIDAIMVRWFGYRLGLAVKKEQFDTAADIIEKSCEYRAKKLGTHVEDERIIAADSFGSDEWNELRVAAMTFRQKYIN